MQREVDLLRSYLPHLLALCRETINRQVGNGLDIVKFHLPLHLPADIESCGSADNFCSGVGESNHKTNSKAPAKRTQRRAQLLNRQTAAHCWEQLVVDRAHWDASFRASADATCGQPGKEMKKDINRICTRMSKLGSLRPVVGPESKQ
jgi:hypothetical protein